MALQGGVGEGTTTRQRRAPRQRVQDVSISEATGITLGTDGYPHPLETTGEGNLLVQERALGAVLEDVLTELRRMRLGMVLSGLIEDVEDTGADG